MNTFLVLLRGVNVGGNNALAMGTLRVALTKQGFLQVSTYINSGNIILQSDQQPKEIQTRIESLLLGTFRLNTVTVKALVLSYQQFQAIIDARPKGFGEQPEVYDSDVLFLIDTPIHEVLPLFQTREGVDMLWPGDGVVYFQRQHAQRTKSKLSKIVMTPAYKSITIRSWNTTRKLFILLNDLNRG